LYSERTRQRRVVGSGLAFEALRGDSPSHTHSGESKRLHNMEHLLPLRFSEIGNECGGDGHHRGRRGTRDKPGRVYSSDGIYSSGFIRRRFIRQTGLDRKCVTTNQDDKSGPDQSDPKAKANVRTGHWGLLRIEPQRGLRFLSGLPPITTTQSRADGRGRRTRRIPRGGNLERIERTF
jgi:hypothetical protein